MLPMPSPRDTPPDRQVRVNRANVIKWMQALPASQREADLPGGPARSAPRRKPAPCDPAAPAHPLPDPAMARLCAVPESAPPYDDEALPEVAPIARRAGGPVAAVNRPGPRRATGAGPAAAAAGPASAGRPPAADSAEAAEPGGREAAEGPEPARSRRDGQQPRATPPWPSQFAQLLAETLAGARSSHQLTPWTTERARGHIRRLGPLLSASQQPRIRRVVASTPASGIVELTVVVNFGPRVRALAVRLERTDRGTSRQSWLCTAIEAA